MTTKEGYYAIIGDKGGISTNRKKLILAILLCLIATGLLWRTVYLHRTSKGIIVFDDMRGTAFEEELSREDVMAVKKVLWGKVRWPEVFYGIPACGFFRTYCVILDDTMYMLAIDDCGTLCAKDISDPSESSAYINISHREKEILEALFEIRTEK